MYPLTRGLKFFIGTPASRAVRANEEIVRRQSDHPADRHPAVHSLDELAHCVKQNVFIPNIGSPISARGYRDGVPVMLVACYFAVGILCEAEDGMLHRVMVILERTVENVSDKEITGRVAIRQ